MIWYMHCTSTKACIFYFFLGGGEGVEVHIRCVNYLMENDGKRIRSFKFPPLYGT